MCFLEFLFLFRQSIKFPEQNIKQSEIGIGDKQLSVELYINIIMIRNYQKYFW